MSLTSLANVKESLGITDSSKDNLINRKIAQAEATILQYLGRSIEATDYTEYYDGGGTGGELTLRNWPLISVTSVSYRDTHLNEDDFTVVDTENYFIDDSAGRIKVLSSLWGRFDRWRVIYRAGYETVPADISEAAADLAAYYVLNSTSSGVKRKKEGQREIEYSTTPALDALGITGVLDTYRDILISGLR